jgi:hypothetical protein
MKAAAGGGRISIAEVTMTPELLAALARAAGLGKALALFPEDVAAAAEQAQATAAAFTHPEAPAAEPWPPMRAPAQP